MESNAVHNTDMTTKCEIEKRLARVKKQSIKAKKEREILRAKEGDTLQNVVSHNQ